MTSQTGPEAQAADGATTPTAPGGESKPIIPVEHPAGGVPPITDTPEAMARAIAALAEDRGPVAVDVERASGYRYGQHAYLVQLFRRGVGTVIVDPTAFDTLAPLAAAIQDAEWVFHAASQDLPSLRELDFKPRRIFDTELAARLLGYPKVGLGTMVAEVLGLGLAKEHSADDWSTRPLPESWLDYAALDVVVLIDLRDALEAELAHTGKLELAIEEFEYERTAGPVPKRPDRWRRTSGTHQIHDQRRLGIVRALWEARDRVAREIDRAPGRVLHDSAIIQVARSMPRDRDQLMKLRGYQGPSLKTRADTWWEAVEQAMALPRAELPPLRGPKHVGPPPARTWQDRNPAAAARLTEVRQALAALSESWNIPVENLLRPELLRRTVWNAPADVASALRRGGARPWQRKAVAPIIERAQAAHPDVVDPVEEEEEPPPAQD